MRKSHQQTACLERGHLSVTSSEQVSL
ncbi:unnamed protein product [Caretta caretta]